MTSQFDELAISAYMDGELNPKTMQEVDRLIDSDESARRYLLNAIRTSAHLRCTFNKVLQEEMRIKITDTLRHPNPNIGKGLFG